MAKTTIHLGFSVGKGEPVSIPLRHMVVTGQTQEAGKTTTLEALIARSKLPAVAFVTKRGEHSFIDGRRIPPYFRERADWQFVQAVLEATMRQPLKPHRAFIIKACTGAMSLADVQRKVNDLLPKARGFAEGIYTELSAYLDIVVPRLRSVEWASRVELSTGINVLDLADRTNFPPELQSLVMRSVLEWIYEKCDGTISIIPEAWEFIPQGRGSPVKLQAIELIRKGAGLKNFVWLDSQDIGGVEKELLRSCPVWLLGVQREANETKRVLDNIPAGVAKPKPADVQTLDKGQFYACFGKHVIKTYVQPGWMTEADARRIAQGGLSIEEVHRPAAVSKPRPVLEEKPMSSTTDAKLDKLIELMSRQSPAATPAVAVAEKPASSAFPVMPEEEALYQRFLARLRQDLPLGGNGPLVVTPPEKLRKDFQRAEADRIVAAIRGLDQLAKRILKLLEAIEGGYLPQKQIAERLGRATGGGSWVALTSQVKHLAGAEFAVIDGKRGVTSNLRAKIVADLSTYSPADHEVEAVYQNVLYEIAQDE